MSMTPSVNKVASLTLNDMAIDNRIYVVRCNLCRRTSHFLARDLVKVYGAGHSAHGVFSVCSKCGKSDYLHVSTRLPGAEDEGLLMVRRPKLVRIEWKWSDSVYVDEDRPPATAREFWARQKEQ